MKQGYKMEKPCYKSFDKGWNMLDFKDQTSKIFFLQYDQN